MSLEHSSLSHEHTDSPPRIHFLAGGALSFWTPTPMTTTYIIYVSILAVVVFTISFLLVRRAKKNNATEKSLSFEVDPDEFITSILDRAVEMQVKIDLVCTRPSLKQKHIQSFIIRENMQAVTQEAPDAMDDEKAKQKKEAISPYLTLRLVDGSIPTGWEQAPIDVYLQLVQNGQGTLYHFASFVCKVMKRGDEVYMTINRPSILGDSQSREEVRIEPTQDAIALASVWLYGKDSNMLPDKVKALGKSFGVFRPEGDSDFRIINISACGVRLRFVQEDIEKLPFKVEKRMEMCLFLAVNTPQEKSNRMLVWIKAECKGLAPCTEDDCVDVRFSFTQWQQIYEKSEDIVWVEVALTHSVPPIMHWIMNSAYGMYGDKHIIEQASTESVQNRQNALKK